MHTKKDSIISSDLQLRTSAVLRGKELMWRSLRLMQGTFQCLAVKVRSVSFL